MKETAQLTLEGTAVCVVILFRVQLMLSLTFVRLFSRRDLREYIRSVDELD